MLSHIQTGKHCNFFFFKSRKYDNQVTGNLTQPMREIAEWSTETKDIDVSVQHQYRYLKTHNYIDHLRTFVSKALCLLCPSTMLLEDALTCLNVSVRVLFTTHWFLFKFLCLANTLPPTTTNLSYLSSLTIYRWFSLYVPP